MAAQCRLDIGRQLCAELVRFSHEVGKGRSRVREHKGAQPLWLSKCILLREKTTPRLAKHVMAAAQAECIDQVV